MEKLLQVERNGVSLDDIVRLVELIYETNLKELRGQCRLLSLCDARKVLVAVASHFGFLQVELSQLINRDHSTIFYYVKKVEDLKDLTNLKRKMIDQLTQEIPVDFKKKAVFNNSLLTHPKRIVLSVILKDKKQYAITLGDILQFNLHQGFSLQSMKMIIVWNTECACLAYMRENNPKIYSFFEFDEPREDVFAWCDYLGKWGDGTEFKDFKFNFKK